MTDATTLEDREQLRKSVREFLAEQSPLALVRERMTADAYDEDLWRGLITMTEGTGAADLAVVFEECGRALAPVPLLATTLARSVTDIDDGVVAAVGWMDGPDWDRVGALDVDGDRLTGVREYVVDGHIAELFVVLAEGGAYVVNAAEVRRTALPTLDQTRRLARLECDAAPARPIGTVDVDRLLDRARIFLAAEMLGGAQACLDMAVSYAKTRQQFGRPVGSFQAIKHTCAEILVQVASARSVVEAAAVALEEDPERAQVLAPLAKAYAGEAFFRAAADNLQIHGGIGFTWEADPHLYFKRAKSSELMFGEAAAQRALLANRLGL
jgi:alkylation response protein AidB-like acyl-CoA dehydrogenase